MQIGRARRAAVALAALAAIVAIGAGITAGAAAGGSTGDAQSAAVAAGGVFTQEDVDADRVSLTARIDENGDATWTIQYRVKLDAEEREQAFDDLERDVEEQPEGYRDRFRERMVRTVETASDATGRDMAVDDVRVTTERRELPESYGVLVYEFHWSNFAVVDGNRVVAGDAISGYFLEEGHSLKIAWPDEYEFQSASPTPDSSGETSVTWTGPVDFGGGDPRVVASAGGAPVSALPSSHLGAVGLGAFAVVVGALYWRRNRVAALVSGIATGSRRPEDRAEQSSAGDSGGGNDSVDGGSAADTAARDANADSEPDGADTAYDETPEELLSNEERVLKLVRENGGRMKQQDVVRELDWTEARTSQIVTGLREDGELESFRLGRENVLRLPEADGEDRL